MFQELMKRELNAFKLFEMKVHKDSRRNKTHQWLIVRVLALCVAGRGFESAAG